ncbi:nicotinamide N-methyltransferase [Crucibulum laeve]|uniref:Protein N-terminal and lysine N-methyltransferase EFM7 n=1 Tax=Crucibulum laeve TaxID=68775 RepID=A0A5C3M288_9AGAR|nr:nicotinamide N-methyltransferase [Crucibulum laeve]
MSDDENIDLGEIFTEPPRPPTPEPTISVYKRHEKNVTSDTDWRQIDIRLVGSHPLWGHYLWNAARSFASYLDAHKELCQDRTVLELGAGGALPSIVAALNGARKTVITDYPDADLVQNIEMNVEANIPKSLRERVDVKGYIWGHPVAPLLDSIPFNVDSESQQFDLIILSDLIFNHSQHKAMLQSCQLALSATSNVPPSVLVFYSHHRPHLAHRDMEFFEKARTLGWTCEEILTETFPPMFPEDSGEESIRSTVHGWRMTR